MEPRHLSGRETGALHPIRTSEGSMTARQFRKQLEGLGWSMSTAARELGVPSGKSRVGEWARGMRKVPPYITAHMVTLKRLDFFLETQARESEAKLLEVENSRPVRPPPHPKARQ